MVDKLVDAMPQVTGDDRQHESRLVLARRAVGEAGRLIGPTAGVYLLAVVPRKLALMAPLWVADFTRSSIWFRAAASLLRLYRLLDLMKFLADRQEDMASPIRWVAFFKFSFIIFATAHWVGCANYLLAASNDFSIQQYMVNWVSSWVLRTEVNFNWLQSSKSYHYAVRCGCNGGLAAANAPSDTHGGTCSCSVQRKHCRRIVLSRLFACCRSSSSRASRC